MAVEWAPEVRVNTLVLGMVRTELSALHYGDAEGVARVGATVPLGRLAEPEEVGAAAVFLASPGAAYISGERGICVSPLTSGIRIAISST